MKRMKLVLLIGAGAVGKMTVGQALARRTGLALFHNHLTIEPVIELFGGYDARTVQRLREVIFEEFAASDRYGLIFTYLWAFDQPEDRAYIEHVAGLFRQHGAEIYAVELIAPLAVRLKRNETENRLREKPSKRDLDASRRRFMHIEERYRCVSREGEIPFSNYLRLDNASLPPDEAAKMIQDRFSL